MKKQDTEKTKALKKEVEKDLRTANMRIKRMQEKGENSPALQKLQKRMQDNNPRFRMGRGATYNELQKLHAEIKRYLNMETSTLRGWDAVKKRTIATLQTRKKGKWIKEPIKTNITVKPLKDIKGKAKGKKKNIRKIKNFPIEITKEQFNDFWEAYEKLKEKDKSITENQLKYGVLDYIYKAINNKIAVDDIIKDMEEKINEIYIEQQKQNAEFDAGAEQFFPG